MIFLALFLALDHPGGLSHMIFPPSGGTGISHGSSEDNSGLIDINESWAQRDAAMSLVGAMSAMT